MAAMKVELKTSRAAVEQARAQQTEIEQRMSALEHREQARIDGRKVITAFAK